MSNTPTLQAATKGYASRKFVKAVLLTLCWLTIQSAYADPDERAQMLKAGMLKKLVLDGWQVSQETHSLLVVQRPAEGSFGFLAQAFMTGANGTKPTIRWSLTFIPNNDHSTYCPYVGTINSQNAFGQTKSWPLKNRKDDAYMAGVLKFASDRLPARYKLVGPRMSLAPARK